MKTLSLGLLLFVALIQYVYGQTEFKSVMGKFTVGVPNDPIEKIDTIATEFGRIPRYSMVAKSVEKGNNLMYIVEILDFSKIENVLSIEDLKSSHIKRRTSNDIGFTLVKEEKLSDSTKSYEYELIFTDKYGAGLVFVRLFLNNEKFYRVETVQLKGSVKFGTKPNTVTRDFFDSFHINH